MLALTGRSSDSLLTLSKARTMVSMDGVTMVSMDGVHVCTCVHVLGWVFMCVQACACMYTCMCVYERERMPELAHSVIKIK